jgi:hypothetical protein
MKIIGKRFATTEGQGVVDTAKALQDEANRIVEKAGYNPLYQTITPGKGRPPVKIPLVAVSLTHEAEYGCWHVVCNDPEEADTLEYLVTQKLNLFNIPE